MFISAVEKIEITSFRRGGKGKTSKLVGDQAGFICTCEGLQNERQYSGAWLRQNLKYYILPRY